MNKKGMGYAVWLLLAACLYFFENNAGTRVILVCSLVFPLVPPLRAAFFGPDGTGGKNGKRRQDAGMRNRPGSEEMPAEPLGNVRLYQPGDPVQRIHWKLTAKKGELLVREAETVRETAEKPAAAAMEKPKGTRDRAAWIPVSGIVLCLVLLAAVSEARRGAMALANRVFAASEAANAYAYARFPVPEGQGVALAAVLLGLAGALLAALALRTRSRGLVLGIMAGMTLFQVYFGLPFPAWINLPLYGLMALGLVRRPVPARAPLYGLIAVLAVSAAVFSLFPNVDPAVESASERVRDWLGRMAMQLSGTAVELPEGETETRHVQTRSLEAGDREAGAEKEYRLVTVEEEQVSAPHRVNYLKAALLLLLAVALVSLPFAPFLVLNARRRKAAEARKAFLGDNVNEAVGAIFQQVVAWLEATGYGAGTRLYRDWAGTLPDSMEAGYPDRFSACAADFEEAVYSSHSLPEEKRERALALLKETEDALWRTAGRKQRFRLKYWMCLCE